MSGLIFHNVYLSSASINNSFSSSVAAVNCYFIYSFARVALEGPLLTSMGTFMAWTFMVWKKHHSFQGV